RRPTLGGQCLRRCALPPAGGVFHPASSGAQRAGERRPATNSSVSAALSSRERQRASAPLRPSPPLPCHNATGGLDGGGRWQAAAPALPAGREAVGRGGALPSAGSSGREGAAAGHPGSSVRGGDGRRGGGDPADGVPAAAAPSPRRIQREGSQRRPDGDGGTLPFLCRHFFCFFRESVGIFLCSC
ncbi:Os09g0403967, partial [Oryza sativa Japonica Group]